MISQIAFGNISQIYPGLGRNMGFPKNSIKLLDCMIEYGFIYEFMWLIPTYMFVFSCPG